MGVVIADRAIELAEQRHLGNPRALAAQPVHDVGHLLAERGRGRRLTVGAREHGQFGMGDGLSSRIAAISASISGSKTSSRPARIISPCDRLLMSSEVQAKWMNSLTAASSGIRANTLLKKILDRLDIMIGGALDLFHAFGIARR
jgi:hypothetical protein